MQRSSKSLSASFALLQLALRHSQASPANDQALLTQTIGTSSLVYTKPWQSMLIELNYIKLYRNYETLRNHRCSSKINTIHEKCTEMLYNPPVPISAAAIQKHQHKPPNYSNVQLNPNNSIQTTKPTNNIHWFSWASRLSVDPKPTNEGGPAWRPSAPLDWTWSSAPARPSRWISLGSGAKGRCHGDILWCISKKVSQYCYGQCTNTQVIQLKMEKVQPRKVE